VIAAHAGSEPIGTDAVSSGSMLGDAAFSVDGTILDGHVGADPAVERRMAGVINVAWRRVEEYRRLI
jgi:hypothetical protein